MLCGASFGSVPLLHAIQRAAGDVAPPVQERAYLQDPTRSALGVAPGQSIGFIVIPANDRPFRWTAVDAGTVQRSGRLQGVPGSMITVEVSTSTATPDTWFTISVAGLPRALRVWIT